MKEYILNIKYEYGIAKQILESAIFKNQFENYNEMIGYIDSYTFGRGKALSVNEFVSRCKELNGNILRL